MSKRRITAIVLPLALLLLALAYFVARRYGVDLSHDHIRSHLDALTGARPVAAAALFFVFAFVSSAAGVSRLLLSALAGAVFGKWLGFALALPATLLGSWCVYSFGRLAGIERVKNLLGARARHIAELPGEIGWLDVMVARQIPLPAPLINLLLAAGGTRNAPFFAGTAVGYLPGTLIAVLLGDQLLNAAGGNRASFHIAAAAMFVAGLLALWMRHALRRKRAPQKTRGG